MNTLQIILTILFGSFSLMATIIFATWHIGNRFAKIESELAGLKEVVRILAHRVEKLENSLKN